MSVGYGYPPYGPQRVPVAVPRVVAAALFALAAGLALGGSFGTISVYGYESESGPASSTTITGWSIFHDPVPEQPVPLVLTGVALAVAAVLALVVALLLVLTARRREDTGAVGSLGVGSGGLLVGIVLAIWLDLVASGRNVAAIAGRQDAIDTGFRPTFEVGAGAYLVLGAALVALAAAVLLLVARRPAPTPLPPGRFPALGPGPGGSPSWQQAPQPWPQPGPGVPPPGWGPPSPPHHE